MKKADDPCVSICEFDGRTGYCRGCGRTLPEVRAWAKTTPFRRQALRRELARRVAKIGPRDDERG